jgi:hypothetical protein
MLKKAKGDTPDESVIHFVLASAVPRFVLPSEGERKAAARDSKAGADNRVAAGDYKAAAGDKVLGVFDKGDGKRQVAKQNTELVKDSPGVFSILPVKPAAQPAALRPQATEAGTGSKPAAAAGAAASSASASAAGKPSASPDGQDAVKPELELTALQKAQKAVRIAEIRYKAQHSSVVSQNRVTATDSQLLKAKEVLKVARAEVERLKAAGAKPP